MIKADEWTAEQLDALPENTLIEAWRSDHETWERFVRDDDGWLAIGDDVGFFSASMVGRRVRVVSVPVAALLTDGVLDAISVEVYSGEPMGWHRALIGSALHTAIVHITGEGA